MQDRNSPGARVTKLLDSIDILVDACEQAIVSQLPPSTPPNRRVTRSSTSNGDPIDPAELVRSKLNSVKTEVDGVRLLIANSPIVHSVLQQRQRLKAPLKGRRRQLATIRLKKRQRAGRRARAPSPEAKAKVKPLEQHKRPSRLLRSRGGSSSASAQVIVVASPVSARESQPPADASNAPTPNGLPPPDRPVITISDDDSDYEESESAATGSPVQGKSLVKNISPMKNNSYMEDNSPMEDSIVAAWPPSYPAPYVLSAASIGAKLVPALNSIVRRPDFKGVIQAPPLELDFARLGQEMSLNDPDCAFVEMVPGPPGEGYARPFVSKKQTGFRWPDFSEVVEKPSGEQIERFLEDYIEKPPQNRIPYYCGVSSFPHAATLHPGHQLAEFNALTTANAQYYHIGDPYSTTGFHCEDAHYWSCNQTDFGWKLWIIVRECHTAKFEQFIRKLFDCDTCDQFVRHQNLLIAPSRLRREGIKFDIRCAGPGDMIITKPRQYHAVVNYSVCFARSINFLLPNEPLFPKGPPISVCPECGLYPLHAHYPALVRVTKKREGSKAKKSPRREQSLKRKASHEISPPAKR